MALVPKEHTVFWRHVHRMIKQGGRWWWTHSYYLNNKKIMGAWKREPYLFWDAKEDIPEERSSERSWWDTENIPDEDTKGELCSQKKHQQMLRRCAEGLGNSCRVFRECLPDQGGSSVMGKVSWAHWCMPFDAGVRHPTGHPVSHERLDNCLPPSGIKYFLPKAAVISLLVKFVFPKD